jgi:UDPglucose 6-dehydrogenase
LRAEGAVVRGYDPQAGARAAEASPALTLAADAYRAADGADALVLCTEWAEFAALDWARIHKAMRRPLVLDGRNFLDRTRLEALGFRVLRMGA